MIGALLFHLLKLGYFFHLPEPTQLRCLAATAILSIMGGQSRKATKKFEKNHLKDIIEQRKDHAKIKQRQQIKAKKKARNASDYAKVSDQEEPGATERNGGKQSRTADALKDMTVDEFFQGGFDIPELKEAPKTQSTVKHLAPQTGKRKQHVGSDDKIETSVSDSMILNGEEVPADDPIVSESEPESESESEFEGDTAIRAHRGELDALAANDPDFYKYLKENDADMLDFAEDADLPAVQVSEEEDEPPSKKIKRKQVEAAVLETDEETEVTMALLEKWRTAMAEQKSLRAMREVVLAFRAAVHVNEEDGKAYKYSISSPEVYHQLLVISLQYVPEVLGHHLPIKEVTSGRVRVPTDSKKYRTLTPLLKSHAASLHHLLENLSDPPTIKLTLNSVLPLLPYVLSFKKALKNLTKTIVGIWSDSSSTEVTRINAFLLIRRLAVISDASLREAVLKTTYQGLVKGSRNTTIHTLPGINLMKNSAAELWGLDPTIGYTTGFTYIRQLAIHLRTSITQPTKDSYKAVYNWQYTHSLDFWSRVLSLHCSTATNPTIRKPFDSPLHPLIYPLVQITLGALRLIPTPTYFPLRFHLARSILRISRSTNTYIPLVPSLVEVLQSPELRKAPKASTLKPLDFNVAIRAPKSYIRTRIYQDGVGEQVSELLAEFFGVWCKSIAFPELVIPPTVLLKRWLKEVSAPPSKGSQISGARKDGKGNKNSKLNSSISLLVQKLDANARYVEETRRRVDFAPSNRTAVEAFLKDVEWENMPLGAFLVGMRKQREQREKILEEGRREEQERRDQEKEDGKSVDEASAISTEGGDDDLDDEVDGDGEAMDE